MRRALLIVVLATLASRAHADGPTATGAAAEHMKRGLARYEAGDYDAAVRELEQGWLLVADPAFRYALGQAERKRGACARAIAHYNAFVESKPAEPQQRAAQLQIDRCRAELDTQAATERARAAERARVVEVAVPWYRDLVGDALAGTGIVAGLVGTLVALDARSDLEHARDSYDAYDEARSASTRGAIGIVTAAAGAALVTLGVLHMALWRPTERMELRIEPSPASPAASLLVRF
jgi:hypothetical protein